MTSSTKREKTAEMIGKQYGRLSVVGVAPSLRRADGGTRGRVRCLCSCGKSVIRNATRLKRGETMSCGCLQKETRKTNTLTHGHTRDREIPAEYRSWSHMVARCHCVTDAKYPDYGGRGISVCDRWRGSYQVFIDDMGERPENCSSLDRIDVNGNYTPENCRWADAKTQSRNRRNNIIVNGDVLSVAAEKMGLKYHTLYMRLKRAGEI